MKSFRLDGNYDVICSGSMLGINYKKIHSNSVGSKTDYEMYSMDFEEFLWAKGYSQDQIDGILFHMLSNKPLNENEMKSRNRRPAKAAPRIIVKGSPLR